VRQKALLFGHAIMATEITPVGDRNPQIVYFASETVYHSQSCKAKMPTDKAEMLHSKGLGKILSLNGYDARNA